MIDIYNRNWAQILLWSIVIIVPVTSLSFLGIIYINGSEEVSIPHYLSGLALFLNFTLCVPPFMQMVLAEEMDETISPLEGIRVFFQRFGLLLIFTILIYVVAVYGMFLFFVPTIFALFFLLIFPFFSDDRSVKEILNRTFRTIGKENLSLFGDVIVVMSINLGIWAIIMVFFEQYENNVLAYLLVRNVMNILVFPLTYIYLTLRYRRVEETVLAVKWR